MNDDLEDQAILLLKKLILSDHNRTVWVNVSALRDQQYHLLCTELQLLGNRHEIARKSVDLLIERLDESCLLFDRSSVHSTDGEFVALSREALRRLGVEP